MALRSARPRAGRFRFGVYGGAVYGLPGRGGHPELDPERPETGRPETPYAPLTPPTLRAIKQAMNTALCICCIIIR